MRIPAINKFCSLLILMGLLFSLASSATGQPESPVPGASVHRAQFTTGIHEREPIDQVVRLDNSTSNIYFFSELRGLEGRTVSHRWEYGGRVISEVPFEVGGSRWRVYSKKTLDSEMLGRWTVIVVDQSGWPLHASIFEYTSRRD
jgi:hypothetical protein